MAAGPVLLTIRAEVSESFFGLLRRLVNAGQIRLVSPSVYWPPDRVKLRAIHTAYSRRVRARRRRR